MFNSINRLADKLLTAVLPQDKAAAACAPDCQPNQVCQNHFLYTQQCCYTPACIVSCGPLHYTGQPC